MINNKKFLFLIISLIFSFKCFSYTCYFIPPEKWNCCDPKKLSKHVYIGYVGKGKHLFNPSINLATEITEASLDEYIKAIKNAHKNVKNCEVRVIGKITNQIDGDTKLIEISKKISHGDIKILQCITKKDDDIFILTGAVLKSEFSKFKNDFLNSFKTLKLTEDLLLEPKEEKISLNLRNLFDDLKEKNITIKEFERHIEKNYNELGSYWKTLVLKKAYEEASTK